MSSFVIACPNPPSAKPLNLPAAAQVCVVLFWSAFRRRKKRTASAPDVGGGPQSQ